MLFGGNPRYENMPLIGRGSPPPTVPWAPAAGWAAEFLSQGVCRETLPFCGWRRCCTCPILVVWKG